MNQDFNFFFNFLIENAIMQNVKQIRYKLPFPNFCNECRNVVVTDTDGGA